MLTLLFRREKKNYLKLETETCYLWTNTLFVLYSRYLAFQNWRNQPYSEYFFEQKTNFKIGTQLKVQSVNQNKRNKN